ncbi:MAG: alginate lyase family protein [Thermoanaerobaculia bacterium]
MLPDLVQELRELGLRGSAFRIGWELKARTGLKGRRSALRGALAPPQVEDAGPAWTALLPFAEPRAVADAMRGLIPRGDLDRLRAVAHAAMKGRVVCFGRWEADFGDPVNWHRNPVTGYQRDPSVYWSRALEEADGTSEVKFVWEVARFPQAYHAARAAAFFPEDAPLLAGALFAQVRAFVQANPPGFGAHWASGQEIVFRLLAWLFALDTLFLGEQIGSEAAGVVKDALRTGVGHVRDHVDYARLAVYNNHLIAEALGLFAAGTLLPGTAAMRKHRDAGRDILDDESWRQFYPDGAYIQLSHNYHRVALQGMLWALLFARSGGEGAPAPWVKAVERSVDFLFAHQNPGDGRLPNYGSNDGALPGVFSTCDFSDFRPTLQAASLATRGERLYEPGPWDEEAAWLLGPKALEAKLAAPRRRSVSFGETGFHVLRSRTDEGTFATFRCGTIRDRFSQIDMLHVDLFWKGLNVLADGGSYLYNGPREWHDHFMETASHNTVTVDGLDQMKHFRKFKCLYWTEAKLLGFRREGPVALASGEHYGYRRHPGGCVHRRSVALHDGGAGVVVDTVTGEGRHRVRLHWLLGEFPHEEGEAAGRVALSTPEGTFQVGVLGPEGARMGFSVAKGADGPARGWLSRYFGEKVPVPSLAGEVDSELPLRFVTVFGPGTLDVIRSAGSVVVESEAGRLAVRLGGDGLLSPA